MNLFLIHQINLLALRGLIIYGFTQSEINLTVMMDLSLLPTSTVYDISFDPVILIYF